MYCHLFIFLSLSFFQLLQAVALPGDAQLMRLPDGRGHRPGRLRHGNTTTSCPNTATNRQCWGRGFNIDTNVESTWPNTGVVREYYLDVQNKTLAPDGTPRPVYAINGQYPGPTIRANWGDTLRITVKNSLQTNGTSMHWHGIRQWRSNPMDGTNGISECPLAPGESRTYTFLATQYGTSWYHSHHSTQYSDGVFGTIAIDGPASANYDYDLGTMTINDWFYETASSIMYKLGRGIIRSPPLSNNILINGTNKNANGDGAYNRVTIEKGKKYRLRIINTGTNDNFKFGLDKHNLTVIAMDFVPIIPFTTDWLFCSIGQRYDVIIDANQVVDSYWFHVVPQKGCSLSSVANAVSIFSYKGANSTTPSSASRNNAPPVNECLDPNVNLVPWVDLDVPATLPIPPSKQLNISFAVLQNSSSEDATLVAWRINGTAIRAEWDRPTLQYVAEHNTSYPRSMNLISLPERNQWSYWVIQSVAATAPPPQPHPIHLHGHNFYVLGAGNGPYTDSTTLNYINPVRRDVSTLPAAGYMIVAFVTDNPGAWLMHCHIAWHIDLGQGAQFLERVSEIPRMLNRAQGWANQCASWDRYDDTALFQEVGSGL